MKNSVKKLSPGTLKRILRYVGKYPIATVCSLLLAIVTVGSTLLAPIYFGDAIDCIVEGNVRWEELTALFVKTGVAVAITMLSQWLMSLCNNYVSCNVVRDIRKDAFAKIGVLPLQYLDSHSHGDTVSRIIADADQFSDGLLMGFTQFFTGIMTILGTIAFMLMTHVWIGLVVIFATPASLFVAKFVSTRTYKYFQAQTRTRGEQTAFVEETITGLKTVQAFAREDENQAKFDEINARLEKAALQATFFSSLTNPSTRFINNLIYALVALLGALAVVSGSGFTVGGLQKFLSYANQYTKPFNEISGVVTELKSAFACAERIFALMDEKEEISDAGNCCLSNVQGNVDLRNVSFSYVKNKPLIENLNLEVLQGQRVAIVGKTGSGKTTLINLLMRFYDVDGGQVCVENTDIRDITRQSLRKNYGMVLQETWLKSATVKENISLGNPGASDEEIVQAAKAAHAHGFIKRLSNGYDTVLGEDGGGLSEGQKQLLCIARILLLLPPMLILDEATSSIDTRTELKISDAFHKLMQGRTSFVVAHRLSTIVNSDVILVMENGSVVEKGSHKELLKRRGAYYHLYQSQFELVASE